MDAVFQRHDARLLSSRGASGKRFFQGGFVELAADEDQAALFFFIGLPGAELIAVKHHMDALDHHAVGIVLETENALVTQQILASGRAQLTHPIVEFGRIEGLVLGQRDAGDVAGMDRVGGGMIMRVMMAVVMMMIMMVVVMGVAAARVAVIIIQSIMIMGVVIVPMCVIMVVVVVMRLWGQKFRGAGEDAVEIKAALIEDLIQRHNAALCRDNPGKGVDFADGVGDDFYLVRRDQIGFVEQDNIGEGNLLFRFLAVLEAQRQVAGIDDGDNAVQSGARGDFGINEECLRHRAGGGEAGGFHQNAIELAGAFHQPGQHTNQVSPHGAADAAIVHFKDFFVGIHDQLVIDADFTELVNDDGVFFAMLFRQNPVQQGGFSSAQIPSEYGYGNLVQHR